MDNPERELIEKFRKRAEDSTLHSTRSMWTQAADELSALLATRSSEMDTAARQVIDDARQVIKSNKVAERVLLRRMIETIEALLATRSPQQDGGPISLNDAQECAVKEWAADDRLWTTQDTVDFNLRTFAMLILKCGRAVLDVAARDGGRDYSTKDCTCLGVCRGADGLGKGWRCALEPRPPGDAVVAGKNE